MAIVWGNACAAAVLTRYYVLYALKIHYGCSNPRCVQMVDKARSVEAEVAHSVCCTHHVLKWF